MRTTGVTKEVRMPVKSLPSNPSLKHLKCQAKDLLNALTQANAGAIARTREFHPKFTRMSDDDIRAAKLSLADAQLIIAREYRFDSWPKLKHHVENLAQRASSTVEGDFKPPAGPVELKQKWFAGERIVREMDLKQKKEIHTPGKHGPDKYDVSMRTQYAFTVVSERPGGGRELDLAHLGFRVEEDSGAYLWRYDSASKSTDGQPSIAEPFKIVIGSKIRYFLNANNQIERMEGVDELVNRLSGHAGVKIGPGMIWDSQALDKVIHRITSGARQPIVADISWLRRMFNEQYFRNKLGPWFLPAEAVQPGDTWNVSRELPMHKGNPVIFDCAVMFQSWEMRGQHICARLEFQGTEKTPTQTQSEAANNFFATTVGTFSGVEWFDSELGRGIETVWQNDFTVTWNRRVAVNPAVTGPSQISTHHYHQVITEKLVLLNGPGDPA
jgi:hypothetical protein